MTNMAYKNKQDRYNSVNAYNAEHYDRINISVPKGFKTKISEHAKKKGENISHFLLRAVDKLMKEEGSQGFFDE